MLAVSIQGISKVDLVNFYWGGHVSVRMQVSPAVYLRDFGPFLDAATKTALQEVIDAPNVSAEMTLRLEAALARELEAWRQGEAGKADDAFGPLPEQPDAENLMRYMRIAVVNWHREMGEEPYPKISGDTKLWLNAEGKMITCSWDVESLWYNIPSLRTFPFDTNEMCAIFWTRVWRKARITEFGRSYGLGTSLQEFDVLGFRGDAKPRPGWDPYICESNIVPNRARPGELMFYGRFWVRRKPFYFVVALLFPTAVVTFMGASAILIASGEAPNSIVLGGESPLSLVAGLMLTMVAMKFSYTDSVPKLGYLTMLDLYIAVSFFFLTAAALLIVLLPEESLRDLRAAAVFSGLCLLFNVVFMVVAYREFRIPAEHSPSLTFPEAKKHAPPE
ncbi:unnamed protein product [Symbiodinium natans]|uniref:Uncharacterized protein n=1 Tax=Symbiodinium natans TaxID=878477 RepID=A0A812RQN6_9DINO|nr:unnamed protein product [Symbiodinium natans]